MKKMLLLAAAVFMMILPACTKDNTCVKQIVEVINQGAEQYKAIDNGSINIDDLAEGELFQMPDGNIFANSEIAKVIDANKDYTLTSEDKDVLIKACNQFKGGEDESMASQLQNQQVAMMETFINDAKTLNDLK